MPIAAQPETCDERGIIDVMDPDRPELDQPWDQTARHETEAERLDRNWSSLLQELRVVQTGVQLLTGLLLTLPFQERFSMLDEPMRIVYLVTVACSAAATALLVAPVGMHRILFRRHRLNLLVSAAHRCAAETSRFNRCLRNRMRCMPTGATSSAVAAAEQATVTR